MSESGRDLASRLPQGKQLTRKWPVPTHRQTPLIERERRTFRCFGAVEQEVTWPWAEFVQLARVEIVSDIHCVTHRTMLEARWRVAIREILRRFKVRPDEKAVTVHADPGYTANMALEDLMRVTRLIQ